jgi:hypothetical protein
MRLLRLIGESIQHCKLDLSGSVVLTEAAAAAYVVTPVVAAMAGASRVYAFTRTTRYGSAEEVTAQTEELATQAGVQDRLTIIVKKTPDVLAQADIVTNSGHLRPIDRWVVSCLKPTAVVPLMYESWEFRDTDVDAAACRDAGICLAGTNERHPGIDVFSYLGVMAVKLLLDAGVPVYRSRVLLLCDNSFTDYIQHGLANAGASVSRVAALEEARGEDAYDAIVVALSPSRERLLSHSEARRIAEAWKGAVVAQFWGDVDRDAFASRGIPLWPAESPLPGHMGVLPSAVGPDPVVRLQAGGLKVGELLWRARRAGHSPERAVQLAVDSGFADRCDVAFDSSLPI